MFAIAWARSCSLVITTILVTTGGSAPAVAWQVTSANDMTSLSYSRRLQQSMDTINGAICGDMEYFCGDADVFLDQAYDASQGSNCSLDTGDSQSHDICLTCKIIQQSSF